MCDRQREHDIPNAVGTAYDDCLVGHAFIHTPAALCVLCGLLVYFAHSAVPAVKMKKCSLISYTSNK